MLFDYEFIPPPPNNEPRNKCVLEPGFQSTPGATALVTGSSGFVGARLVEMLLERGAKKVICFDIVEPSPKLVERFNVARKGNESEIIFYSGSKDGNLVNEDSVDKACGEGVDIVYHIAALVGPYHDREKYYAVNYQGTKNLLDACQNHKIFYFVFASSPSTRFDGKDIKGKTEDDLSFPDEYVQLYAETKAAAEREVTRANCNSLLTVSVAPHQVYGPHDTLFLPSILDAAGSGKLRIFGKGENKISVCYVDNYCHGLMCGADALTPGSSVLGKFYIITDDHDEYFWRMINDAGMEMGFQDLFSKFHLPVWLLLFVAHVLEIIGNIINKKFLLSTFSVKMMIIDRYFIIKNAKNDLKYSPLVEHDVAWSTTKKWFKANWLPKYLKQNKKTKKED